jgi:hypothetical protein
MTLDNGFVSRSEGTYGCSGKGLFRHIWGAREGYLGSKAEEKGPRQSRVQKIGYDYEHKEAFLREEWARVRRAVSGTLRRSASVLFFLAHTLCALFKVRMGLLSIIVLVYSTLPHYYLARRPRISASGHSTSILSSLLPSESVASRSFFKNRTAMSPSLCSLSSGNRWWNV